MEFRIFLSGKELLAIFVIANYYYFFKMPTTEKDCQCMLYPKPTDCEEVMKNGNRTSGVYVIWPWQLRNSTLRSETLKVYCDMETSGGGWTVIQRRGSFKTPVGYFDKTWQEYKAGFGKLEEEFWLGNDNIYALTNQKSYSARFDMKQTLRETAYAEYEYFWIEEEAQKYRLHIKDYSGDAGDALKPHNECNFYTKAERERSHQHKGGWWLDEYPSTNLNGLNVCQNRYYTIPPITGRKDGITWHTFGGSIISLPFTEIKIRSRKFHNSIG